jgi:hypothetical protein
MEVTPGHVLTELQSIFQKLQVSLLPVSPEDLTRSFGWGPREINEAQDVFEFWEVFRDHSMVRSNLKSLQDLISGSYISNLETSQREETFLGGYI